MDVAKGLAIILVALGHVERGLVNAGLVSFDGWAGQLDAWLYAFHIPLFMFLAGLFVATSVRRYGMAGFLRRRLVELLWVYLVWELINTSASVVLASVTNGEATWLDVVRLWAPYGAMWFLPSLALGTLVVAPAWWWAQDRSGPGVRNAALAALVVVLTAASAWLWIPMTSWPWDWVRPQLWSFLAVGVVVGAGGLRRALATLPALALAAIALGGAAAVVTAAALIARHAETPATGLAYLGVRSLAIYVSHTNFTAGTRVALGMIGLTALPLEVVAGVVVGVAGPLLLYAVAQRAHLGWLYRPPSALSGAGGRAAPRRGTLAR